MARGEELACSDAGSAVPLADGQTSCLAASDYRFVYMGPKARHANPNLHPAVLLLERRRIAIIGCQTECT